MQACHERALDRLTNPPRNIRGAHLLRILRTTADDDDAVLKLADPDFVVVNLPDDVAAATLQEQLFDDRLEFLNVAWQSHR